MSTDLSIYERIPDPMAAVTQLGNVIARSGVATLTSIEQGHLLAWECLSTKTPILTLIKENHFIGGKLSMKADCMLAKFMERGGKVRQLQRTPDVCEIELTPSGGEPKTFKLTWAEAQCEPYPYDMNQFPKDKEASLVKAIHAWQAGNGKQPEFKTKYSTPRARMQMQWARLVSDSVRSVDPGVNYGRYTPEEIDDFTDDETPPEKPAKQRKTARQVMEEAATSAASPVAGEVVDGSFTVIPDDKPTTPSATPPPTGEPEFATHTQVEQIRNLYGVLGIGPDQQAEILRNKGVSSLRSLTFKVAGAMLDKLQATAAEIANKEEAAIDSAAGQSMELDGPCSADQVTTIKTLATEIEQLQPGITGKVKAKILAAGLQKIADLTCREADVLLQALRIKNLEAFFTAAITGFTQRDQMPTDEQKKT